MFYGFFNINCQFFNSVIATISGISTMNFLYSNFRYLFKSRVMSETFPKNRRCLHAILHEATRYKNEGKSIAIVYKKIYIVQCLFLDHLLKTLTL